MRKNLIEEFDNCYSLHSEKIAVVDGEEQLSFVSLAARAVQLGLALSKVLVNTKNQPIAILLPKCIDLVVSDLAVQYSSNIFMNLDTKLPQTRLFNILGLVQPVMIITNSKFSSLIDKSDIQVMNLDAFSWNDEMNELARATLKKNLMNQIDTDPFCIINTSGSTGTPKGVVLNHRSFFDFYNWSIETFDFDESLIIGSLSPAVFDIYDYELCLLMLSGATMVLLNANLAIFPARLLEHVAKNNVNFIFWVPTIMVNIANKDLLEKLDLRCLKTVWFAGEVFPTKQFNYWRRQLPDATFVNLYGPIEITLDCTYYIAESELDEDAPLPIGIPCRNTDVLILNDKDEICDIEEIGELCVRGTSLAMGYYNAPEKTSVAFVQNPLNKAYPERIYRTGDLAVWNKNGLIQFKGRKDSLIKHMGYRIELGEIEHIAVNVLKIVPNCCVVYNKGKKSITLVYEKTDMVTDLELKKALGTQMPKYMVPTDFIQVDILPRNTNGKIDRLKISQQINSNKIIVNCKNSTK